MFGLGIWELIALCLIGLILVLIVKGSESSSDSRTTTCRDCNGLVSKSAKKCPHCGADVPYFSETGFGFLSFIKAIFYCALIFAGVQLVLFGMNLTDGL